MGYFSSGTEGMDYKHLYCERCVHDMNGDCPVWFLHLAYNGEEDKRLMLDALIPRREGIYNGRCRMFIDKEAK